VDSKEKIIHTVKVSAANVADSLALPHLLHGKETRVYGDQAYRGQGDVIRKRAPKAKDFINQPYRYNGQIDETSGARTEPSRRSAPSGARLLDNPKDCLAFTKVRYRGLAKNLHRMQVTLPRWRTCSWFDAGC